MINCEWIRKQKKDQSAHGSSPGPKCKPNVRLRVRCANTQQPCFSALCDAWLLRKRDEIRESSYIKYRAILEHEKAARQAQSAEKREKKEIGLHSVRGGTIVGEHQVIFAGQSEVLTLSHSAQSKELFAAGAVNAAVFMAGKGPGLYDMSHLI